VPLPTGLSSEVQFTFGNQFFDCFVEKTFPQADIIGDASVLLTVYGCALLVDQPQVFCTVSAAL
jgi:hypothetical protein